MKKALPNTKVTVKLRRSNYKEEWYLIIESYPVYKRGSTRASRVVESINRTISTLIWDKSSIVRILPDGTFNYKPKRDLNGIIQCRSTIDQEACIYADNVRKLRQHEYDSAILYTDKENEIAAQIEHQLEHGGKGAPVLVTAADIPLLLRMPHEHVIRLIDPVHGVG